VEALEASLLGHRKISAVKDRIWNLSGTNANKTTSLPHGGHTLTLASCQVRQRCKYTIRRLWSWMTKAISTSFVEISEFHKKIRSTKFRYWPEASNSPTLGSWLLVPRERFNYPASPLPKRTSQRYRRALRALQLQHRSLPSDRSDRNLLPVHQL
jgi:hypothetical protein